MHGEALYNLVPLWWEENHWEKYWGGGRGDEMLGGGGGFAISHLTRAYFIALRHHSVDRRPNINTITRHLDGEKRGSG